MVQEHSGHERELQRTPLRDFHAAHGGRLVDFAGWEMPVQYRSILEEHKAVRRAAGLFDVSHMGEVDVSGRDAGRFLNHLVTNDVAKLFPGRVLYTPMCYPEGGVVDDLLVYMKGPEDYFLCINAGNIAKDLAWIREQASAFSVTVTDRSEDFALLAVQGPRKPHRDRAGADRRKTARPAEILSFLRGHGRRCALPDQSDGIHGRGWGRALPCGGRRPGPSRRRSWRRPRRTAMAATERSAHA